MPSAGPEFRFMNPSSARVPCVFQAEGPGLRLLLSPNRTLLCTWTHVSCRLPPLSLPKEERDSGRGAFLFMLPELHLFSNGLEEEKKLHSPKYGQNWGAASWPSLPKEMCPASHFPPKDPSLGTYLSIQRSYSLGGVGAGASPAESIIPLGKVVVRQLVTCKVRLRE